jgi:Ca-activated chloride channel family protein
MAMMIGDIEFLLPGFLWLLPALALLTLLCRKSALRSDDAGIHANSFISPTSDLQVRHPLLAKLSSGSSTHLKYKPLDTIVIWLVLVCLVLALAAPVRTGSKIPDPPEQRDITFIVDASVSMLLRDYILDGQRIDRMSFLKSFLDRFVQQLEGDRISVIVFGVKESGSNPERRRILVLFTDADESTDSISPVAAAELAREAGLPLYTVAIGASTYDAAEEELAGLIYHPANIELLKNLAIVTGAKSYQAGDEKALNEAIADIDQREKYKKEVLPRYFSIPLYPIPLIAGLLLLSLYQFVRLGWSIVK